jgi:ABC-2 type transport system ATP-binding protein
MNVIDAKNLRKTFGTVAALDNFDLCVPPGRIVGLIGPNGSGKTTALRAVLGLTALDSGELSVNGCSPWEDRAVLMQDVAYIPDTGILPRWMKVADLIDYVANIHTGFKREKAMGLLATTSIDVARPVSALSKGMQVQLHLALILAIDARLLVLDEPTLGLDILYREHFYDTLLDDFMEGDRSILITTHEVREIEHVLSDVVFIQRGRSMLAESIDGLRERYVKLTTARETQVPAHFIARRTTMAGTEYIYRDAPRDSLAPLGSVTSPNLVELFVAIMEPGHA